MPILLLAVTIVIADQYSKYYLQTHMLPGESIPVFENVFHITYVLNPGAAFGILQHYTGFFVLVAIIMLAGAIYFYPKIPAGYTMMRFGVWLMIGGAFGNLVDRVKTGYVVDFLDFRIWPVFNIADIAIVTGVCCILFNIVFLTHKEDEQSG